MRARGVRYGCSAARAAYDGRHALEVGAIGCRGVEIESLMTTASRRQILEQTGLSHPRPEAVSAPLFDGREPFFLALDKVQVKYEMLRAHVLEGLSATA